MKQKILLLTAAVCLLLGCIIFLPQETVKAATYGDFVYEVDADSNTITITKYKGSGKDVKVPGKIGSKSV